MTRRETVLFIISIVGTAVSAAVLLLSLPRLIDGAGAPLQWWAGVAAVALVVFGVGTRRWRPTPPRTAMH